MARGGLDQRLRPCESQPQPNHSFPPHRKPCWQLRQGARAIKPPAHRGAFVQRSAQLACPPVFAVQPSIPELPIPLVAGACHWAVLPSDRQRGKMEDVTTLQQLGQEAGEAYLASNYRFLRCVGHGAFGKVRAVVRGG